MGTFKNNQKGFGVIEVLMVLGIVILIGAAGWLVYKNQNKAHTQNKTAKTLQQDLKGQVLSGSAPNPSQYNGWQSFCSSYGGLCLKYPASWKITQATYPPGTEPNGQEVDTITSPSGNVKVVYMPSAQVSGDRQVETITVASATKTDVSDLGVFQLINALSPSQFAVENFVTLTTASHALNSTDSPFTQGATIANASEPPYHQFTNPERPEDIGQQLLVVTNSSGDPAGNTFASSAAAQAWLNSAEVQTASQILGSVTYSP